MSINYGALAGIGALTSGLNFVGGITASNVSAHKAKKLAATQAQLNYKYNKKWAQESPSLSRTGLETAGYNPMLAVQNGTTGGNASSFASPNTANDVDLGLGSGLSNALNVQNMKNQTEQTESINDKNYAEADEAKARKQAILEKMPFISKREKVEISNIQTDSMKKEAEIHNLEETTRYIEKNFELAKRLGEMGINVQRYGIDKNLEGVIYNADTKAETDRGIVNTRFPFGVGETRWYSDDELKELLGNHFNR